MVKGLFSVIAVSVAASQSYEPARAERVVMEGTPVNTAAAGVVLAELTVDARGLVTDTNILQALDPYTGVVQSSVRNWSFAAARDGGVRTDSHVLVACLFRPAMLMFPAPDRIRTPEGTASEDTPLPKGMAVPPYPPNAVGGAYVVTELEVDENGTVRSVKVVSPPSGFDDSALSTARQWSFSPAERDGAGVPSFVYLIFGFRQPN